MNLPQPTPDSKTLLSSLAKPSATYKRQAWLAMLALATFVILYLGLAAWFLVTAYRLSFGSGNSSSNAFWGWVVAACSSLLAIFMLKGLFFVQRGGDPSLLEIKPEQQPRLFEFLNQLADEAGAPRPHRVYLSARVNAAVFYDLSIANLLLPSKKNLEIGLGLVNVLNQGELRAVLAHEFGHFAQRAMAVGRWVYIAQQIAGHLVARRDAWDNFLNSWSQLDFRIAWVAWLLRIVIWSIRSVVDTMFSVVVVIQRALSREMELQADLVAVSLTGSDALIHALHLLHAADDSWGRAVGYAFDEKQKDRITPDLFELQSFLMDRMARLLNDETYAKVPALPSLNPEQHRLFKEELGMPPKMWLTHPLNHEREENAKRHYIAASIASGSAWDMFDDVPALRQQVTNKFLESDPSKIVSNEVLLKDLQKQFDREHLKSHYRGTYYGRSPVRYVAKASELLDFERPFNLADFDLLYPESLSRSIEQRTQVEKELEQLKAIQQGYLQANKGKISLRGRELKANELPRAIKELEQELATVDQVLHDHDRLCRSVHYAAAKQVQNGWPEYLSALVSVVHYADHTAANILDAYGFLNNVLAVETATRNVSESGVNRILAAANGVFYVLRDVYREAGSVTLDHVVRQRLETESWMQYLGELKLHEAQRETINEWLQVVNGWVTHTANSCAALRLHALEQLLISESVLARNLKAEKPMIPAPVAPTVPASYDLLMPGKERQRQTSLNWWARFQTADGWLAGAARFSVSLVVVGTVLGFSHSVGKDDITIYNGLNRDVIVHLGTQTVHVRALATTNAEIEPSEHLAIKTTTTEGEVIENFDADVHARFVHFVYNVASASPLIEWTKTYGNASPRKERYLGTPRWIESYADAILKEPPNSVSSKTGGATREVLTGFANEAPHQQLQLVEDQQQIKQLIQTHARWDLDQSPHLYDWFQQLDSRDTAKRLVADRLKNEKKSIVLLRMWQDLTDHNQQEAVCNEIKGLLKKDENNGDLQYLVDRCLATRVERQAAFQKGLQRWPRNSWYIYVNAYQSLAHEEWDQGLKQLQAAASGLPILRGEIAIEQARVLRLMRRTDASSMKALAEMSPRLQYWLFLESQQESDVPEIQSYRALEEGRLKQAITLLDTKPSSQLRMLRLAAASTGADENTKRRAWSLGAKDGIDNDTVWSTMGLALRENRELSPYWEFLAEMPADDLVRIKNFIELLKKRDVMAAQASVHELTPEVRAQVYCLAMVYLGNKTPVAWTETVKRYLFASERPFFS